MKGKRHTPEQIIAKLREADSLLATGATIGHFSEAGFTPRNKRDTNQSFFSFYNDI